MKKISGTEFRSDFGFASPNFFVDSQGNLTARSISTAAGGSAATFTFTDDENGAIFVEPLEGFSPSFDIAKTQAVTLDISLDLNELFFLRENKQDLFSDGLQHSSGDTGVVAQGKSSGVYTINIPADYTEDTIFYTNRDRSFFGEINVVDPIGIFSSLTVSSEKDSLQKDSGALTVSGGIGVSKSITVGDSVNTTELETSLIRSNSSLDIDVQNDIRILKQDSSLLGVITDSGSTIPVTQTVIEQSAINSTSIGQTVPDRGTFARAQVISVPSADNDITNKSYVDTQDIAFSIAFGL